MLDWAFSTSWLFKILINLWPPFLLTGIKVTRLSADFRELSVRLKLWPWNRNAVGVHFGGSLYAMTDPFYMLMLKAQLGSEYVVWDKYADIDYIKPGKGTVTCDFNVAPALIDDILEHTASGEKYLPQLTMYVVDQQGELVAKVNRTLYIRRKKPL